MALFQRIATAAGVRLSRVGNVELVAARDMAAFLESAQRMRVGILRIEAVRVAGDSSVPDLNAIADYSGSIADPAFVERSIGEVLGFLAIAGREDHFYEVAILGRNPLVD